MCVCVCVCVCVLVLLSARKGVVRVGSIGWKFVDFCISRGEEKDYISIKEEFGNLK